MPDRLNPIGAEFGDMGGEVAPVKPEAEIQESDAFKREMDKKARTVNEKERSDKKDEKQLEHETIVEKPIVQEAKAQQEMRSILDVQKPNSTSSKETAKPEENAPAPKTKIVAASSSDTSTDLSKDDDSLTQKLPDAPLEKAKDPEKVFEQKQVAPPPLTTPLKETGQATPVHVEKKAEAPIQTHASSGDGQSSMKQKEAPSFQPPSQEKKEQPEAKPLTAAPKTVPVEPSHKTPLLEPSTPKPLLAAPQEAPKVTQVQTSSPLETPQEKPAIQAPAQTSDTSTSLGNKPDTLAEAFQEAAQKKPGDLPLNTLEKGSGTAASPLFETPFVAETRKDDIKASKTEEERKAEKTIVQAPSESNSLEKEKHDEENQGGANNPHILEQMIPAQTPLQTDAPPSLFQEAIGFDRLPPHILDLFDRVVGVITVMQVQGKTETTIHLNERQSPLLQGTSVTITTFDTAPLAYNIELKGPPQAVTILQKNVDGLKKSLKDPKKEFNFQVHEIMISLDENQEK